MASKGIHTLALHAYGLFDPGQDQQDDQRGSDLEVTVLLRVWPKCCCQLGLDLGMNGVHYAHPMPGIYLASP